MSIYLPLKMCDRRLLLDSGAAAPPIDNGNTTVAVKGRDHFDSNMVIILAALLCALLCAVGLNSVARFILRFARRSSPPPSDPAAGIDKADLRRIPVVVYGAGALITAAECSICLGELRKGEKVRILPRCSHGFHVGCIDEWFVSHSSCPVCRQPLIETPTSGGDEFVSVELR